MNQSSIKRWMRVLSPIIPIGFIALISRWLFMTKADIWHDEGYSTMIINLPPADIIATSANDVHPPLYYLLLSGWQTIFGPSLTSLRGFSVVVGVLTVVLLYFILHRQFSKKIAVIGGLFVAIGPFLIRYSNEVRMYGLATLLAVASTYLLILARNKQSKHRLWLWLGYGLLVASGIYTQYFFIFIVPAHVIYLLYLDNWDFKQTLRDKNMWFGYLLAGGLFLPWLPTMLSQMSRVQQGFWIPPLTLESIPGTISKFVLYDNSLVVIFGYTLLIGVIALPLYLTKKNKQQAATTLLLAGWLAIPILGVALLSLNRPVYVDRYFTYSAPAFYALLAISIGTLKFKRWPQLTPLLVAVCCGLFIMGINNVTQVANHRMGHVATTVNRNFRAGDKIISAELYTFFDFSYYNQTGQPVHLLSEKPFGKYGEYSLLHNKPQLRVADLNSVTAKRVWLVGKTGKHDYFSSKIPGNWHLLSTSEDGDSAIRLYEIR